jgi:hypothetical protein
MTSDWGEPERRSAIVIAINVAAVTLVLEAPHLLRG